MRPYRVGMSCAFCHVGPNPTKPPADPENPKWENLSSNVGAQYFWVDRIFDWNADPSTFVYQLFHTSRPGSLDTSLISTTTSTPHGPMDCRVSAAAGRLPGEALAARKRLAGGGLDNRQFNDYAKEGPLTQFFEGPGTVWTPRVLKDGADSVGALGALNRVYINIGTFSEEWLLHFNALVGGRRVSPIAIADARKNSAYFQATEAHTLTSPALSQDHGAHHLQTTGGARSSRVRAAADARQGGLPKTARAATRAPRAAAIANLESLDCAAELPSMRGPYW